MRSDATSGEAPVAAVDLDGVRVTIAVGDGCVGLDPGTHHNGGLRRWLAAQSLGAVRMLGVAVPDRWRAAAEGVPRIEQLRALLCDAGLDVGRCVGRTEAAAAALAATGRDAHAVLVCDVGPAGISAGLYTVDRASVSLRSVETAADGAAATAFIAGLATGLAIADARHTEVDDLLRATARRMRLVADRAATLHRYRRTPVLRAGGAALTAGEVAERFAPLGVVLREVVGALVARSSEDAEIRAVALVGGLGPLPLTASAVLAALGRGDPVDVAVLAPDMVAAGALAVAAGRVRCASGEATAALSLPVHRLRGGRLVADRVALAAAGSALPAEVAARSGEPVVVEVGDTHPTAGAPLAVDVDVGGGWRRAVVEPVAPVPPGRYRAGLWPLGGAYGALVLRAMDGGAPLVYTVCEEAQ